MKIIINADDYGLTGGISDSIIELFQENAISNTTVMVCTSGVETQCQKLKDAGFSHKAGVHLQTTLERHHNKPLSKPEEIQSLTDKSGKFKHHECSDPIEPNEVKLEWERQIECYIDIFGHKPSHIDSHHGRHRKAELTPAYLELAQKYNVPVRGGKKLGQIDGNKFGVQCTALCESTWTGQDASIAVLKEKVLDGLKEVGAGVLEVVCHPGFCDDDLMVSSDWNIVRENDYKVLLALAQEGWLEREGIQLVQYPALGENNV